MFDFWQDEEGMIESEDGRSSSEPEDNQEQVGHQILLMNKVFSLKGILSITNVKNACQPFHVECQVLVTSEINISLI